VAGAPTLTVVTWNLHGSHGCDVDAVTARIRALAGGDPDVIALQEVQRRQAIALATRLGMTATWKFKHWPIVERSEGLAVLTPHRLTGRRGLVLQRAPFWSWRRRIAILARISRDDGDTAIVNAHFSPHDLGAVRALQVGKVLAALDVFASDGGLVVGDLNDHPGSTPHVMFARAGWQDAWITAHGDGTTPLGATNWTAGERAGRPPTQRIDYVLLPTGWEVDRVAVPDPGADGYDEWAALSDHLPLCAVLRRAQLDGAGAGGEG
jgi:endonuclease/exonuclease/phosphatase family metal-dependent hydrolase